MTDRNYPGMPGARTGVWLPTTDADEDMQAPDLREGGGVMNAPPKTGMSRSAAGRPQTKYGNKQYHQWETEKGNPFAGPRRAGPTERSPIAKPDAAMESRGVTLDFMKKHGPE